MFPSDETPAERSLRARTAVHSSWARTDDRTARTAPGRAAFAQRFEDQVDPDRTLSPQVRAQRADAARKAYFANLARQSSVARRRKRDAAKPQ